MKKLLLMFILGLSSAFLVNLLPTDTQGQWVCVEGKIKTIADCMLEQSLDTPMQHHSIVQKPNRRRDIHRLEEKGELPLAPQEECVTQELPFEDTSIKRLRSSPAQKIGLNFTAATISNVQDPYIIPPNLSGWVGPEQYILMTYNVIRSFNKTTGLPDGILNIDAANFFGVCANDVRIDYDRFSERWFMACEGINSNTGQIATLVLAVSGSSIITATTPWYFYTFSNAQIIPQISPAGSGDLDYQQMAVDQNAVYISMDTFDRSGAFCGSSVIVIKKSSIGTSNLVSKVFYGLLKSSAFIAPVDNFDSRPTFGYLVNALANIYPSKRLYTKLYFYRIINPASGQPSLSGPIAISVPNYTDPANAPYAGNLFSSAAFLQTSGTTICASHVRNHQLYVCHNIQVNRSGVASISGDRVGVRWYQFDLTGDATGKASGKEKNITMPALVQSGTLFDAASTRAPLFYFVPAIMTNKNGDLVIACTVSGANASPNVVYAGRKATDPKGVLRSPVMLTSSSYSYNFGPFVNPSNGNIGQRWGDLSSLCPDPVNDLDIWSTQEFAAVQNGWGVQVAQLTPA